MNLFGTCDLRTWDLRVQNPGQYSCHVLLFQPTNHRGTTGQLSPTYLCLCDTVALVGGQFSLDH